MRFNFAVALSGLLATSAALPAADPEKATRSAQIARTPIDAATYAAVSKYPAYSTAIYLMPFIKPCIQPFKSVLVDLVNVSFSDTQMGIYRNDYDKEIILGIPGANSTFDAYTVVNFGQSQYSNAFACFGCMVHTGIQNAWNSVATQVKIIIASQMNSHQGYKVKIAGHSLGGALCTFAYTGLVEARIPIAGAYCSGGPRVGNQAYANYIDKLSGASDTNQGNFYRSTHYNDGVPQLPPSSWGFVHPRTEYFQAAYNATQATTYRCYGQEAKDCNWSMGQNQGIPNAHETYAGVRYDCNNGYLPSPPNP